MTVCKEWESLLHAIPILWNENLIYLVYISQRVGMYWMPILKLLCNNQHWYLSRPESYLVFILFTHLFLLPKKIAFFYVDVIWSQIKSTDKINQHNSVHRQYTWFLYLYAILSTELRILIRIERLISFSLNSNTFLQM